MVWAVTAAELAAVYYSGFGKGSSLMPCQCTPLQHGAQHGTHLPPVAQAHGALS